MDLAYFLGRAWDFILWFATMVVGTVASSIFGGWYAVLILAAIAFVLFILTRASRGREKRDEE
jgi:membrane protein implicated in regulation of membrane protease activity